MGFLNAIKSGINLATEISKNEDLMKMICGTYSDGSTKSIYDAFKGETESPKQKKKKIKKRKKNKEKMKRKKYKKFYI